MSKPPQKTTYKAIGMMSGTSLDGIDLAYCHFWENEAQQWQYQLLKTGFFPYEKAWQQRLGQVIHQNAIDLIHTHFEYGHYVGKVIHQWVQKEQLEGQVDLVASHGQTIYHLPEKGISAQIGDGAAIAAQTGIPVVANLRVADLAAGGQGAPIVPIGDRYLFADHRYCLNIGGIANISYPNQAKTSNQEVQMVGYDICGANLILNHLAQLIDKPYDKDGAIARSGQLYPPLFEALNQEPYFAQMPPKTLGAKWVRNNIIPILEQYPIPISDQLRTVTEHIAFQIGQSIQQIEDQIIQKDKAYKSSQESLLVTGGGAHNQFLIERISAQTSLEVVVPDRATVDYKEALVMAFIGVLRWLNRPNCLATVTGATRDVCGGAIFRF